MAFYRTSLGVEFETSIGLVLMRVCKYYSLLFDSRESLKPGFGQLDESMDMVLRSLCDLFYFFLFVFLIMPLRRLIKDAGSMVLRALFVW
jgi:hypothetical protein